MKNRAFAVFLSLALLTACSQEGESAETLTPSNVPFEVIGVAKDLNYPWSLAFLPHGEYLITERQGKLWRIAASGDRTEIKGVPPVYNEGQGGLLDIALEPKFKDGGWIYFSYAAADQDDKGNTEVARAKLNLRQNALENVEVIFRAQPKVEGGNHWGSRLLFAPDGTLFITLGERFDHAKEAQGTNTHFGKIIRIKPDGKIPSDNPFVDDKKSLPDIYSYGHRNVQGLALNPETGAIWAHEHGPKGGDEINILKPGANYGWPLVTFGINYWGTKISDKTTAPGMEDPILQWTPSIAPSGMAFYTGEAFPQWKGDLFVGALAKQHLRRIKFDGTKVVEQEELLKDRKDRIRDVRQGPDGFLYVLTDEADGELLRIAPQGQKK